MVPGGKIPEPTRGVRDETLSEARDSDECEVRMRDPKARRGCGERLTAGSEVMVSSLDSREPTTGRKPGRLVRVENAVLLLRESGLGGTTTSGGCSVGTGSRDIDDRS
jgi:hypothetical protein